MLWPWLILVTAYGACVGSFLNVAIHRLPEGRSLLRPASHCPKCEHRLAWYDNLPVVGWVLLRGRCRYCGLPISLQYPLVEAATALLFGGYFWVVYASGLHSGFPPAGLPQTWHVLIVHLVLLAGLLAATVIDARLFIIPLEIPWTCTLMALLALPLGAVWFPDAELVSPSVSPFFWGSLVGATAGLILANVLLWLGWLPRSFEEEESHAATEALSPAGSGLGEGQNQRIAQAGDAQPATDHRVSPHPSPEGEGVETACPHGTPEQWLAHPHPRREVLKECLLLTPVVLGALAGHFLLHGTWSSPAGGDPGALGVLTGVVMGYLVGGGLIWVTRVGGTLVFGKEAMGLGDVHLLAAIGAVIGPVDVVLVFFIAPVLGLLYALIAYGTSRMLRGQVRVIPYGPYLAAAALLVMMFQDRLIAILFP